MLHSLVKNWGIIIKAVIFLITVALISLTLATVTTATMYRAVDQNYKFVYRIENRIKGSVEYYVVEIIDTTIGVERLLRLRVTYDNGTFKAYAVETVPESALSLYVPVLFDYDVTRLLSEGKSTLSFPIRVSDWNKPVNETQPYAYKTIVLKPRDYDTIVNLTEGVVKAIMCSGFENPYSLAIYIDQTYGLLLKLVATDIATGSEAIVINLEYSDLIGASREQTLINRPKLEARIAKYITVILIAAIVAAVVYVFSRID